MTASRTSPSSSRTVVLVECWACDEEFFVPFEVRGYTSHCPYCGNRNKDLGGDGLATQGRTFEVSANA